MSKYFHENEDGTVSFLFDTEELAQIRVALDKAGVRVLDDEEAVFNTNTGKSSDSDMTVDGDIEDIEFALADLIKFIRPYPKRSD